jgi:tripartite-type tricarboxylate transporter receptor subunit TctC
MNRRFLLLASLLMGASSWCAAQGAWPSKPITMIVPFPPGGLADLVARPVAEAMSRDLGQPVVIENKAGAGGGIGMGLAAKAKPDGYTILLALSSLTVIPEADVLLGRPAMFALPDLRPVARFTADPTVLAVRADAPWKTAQQFIDDAKKRPGAINYGSSGNYGNVRHLHGRRSGRGGAAGWPDRCSVVGAGHRAAAGQGWQVARAGALGH